VLVCAEDGWVDYWSDGIPTKWNYMGCSKYQSILIFCLHPDGRLDKVKPILPKLNWLEKIFWRITNSSKVIAVEVSNVEQPSLAKFKSFLVEAVKTDDDLLTQFKSKGEILKGLSKAESYSEIHTLFTEFGWV